MLAAEFTIDNEVSIEHLDDDEILATMQEEEGDDEKAAEPQPNISLKVLESVDNLLQFISNPPKEHLFDPKTLSILCILRSKISHYQIDTLRQSQIDRFITL